MKPLLPLGGLPLLARGSLRRDVPLGATTWLGVGGGADVLLVPKNKEDLGDFLSSFGDDAPAVLAVGAGTNMLVRDGGVRGLCVRLGASFAWIRIEEGGVVCAGAATPLTQLARAAARAGIAGFEFMEGIPGRVGGALAMNAGAFGRETGQALRLARAIDKSGRRRSLKPEAMGLGYRRCDVSAEVVFTDAEFLGEPDDPDAIVARMATQAAHRAQAQPTRVHTAGSTFANPPGMRAWELLDAAGCRDLRQGDAHWDATHCNFLVNGGAASAADIETLGERARAKVLAHSGITLEWEIRRVGEARVS